jgi:hypothetical protein
MEVGPMLNMGIDWVMKMSDALMNRIDEAVT